MVILFLLIFIVFIYLKVSDLKESTVYRTLL